MGGDFLGSRKSLEHIHHVPDLTLVTPEFLPFPRIMILVRKDVKPRGQCIKVIPRLRWQIKSSLRGGLETAGSGWDPQHKLLPGHLFTAHAVGDL